MSFVKIWIHAVWSTKNRKPLLKQEFRQEVFSHIKDNAIEKEILIEIVNGHNNHVHCLFRLKNDQTISKVLQLIKGESSFWINQQKIIKEKFQWQNDYFAVSVSESGVSSVKKYIRNQEEHHKKINFTEEYEDFIKKYDFQVFRDES